MDRYIPAYAPDSPPPPGEVIWSDVNGTHRLVILGTHVVPSPDVADMCHQCPLHPVDFEGDICEDCAWDIHDQLDGAE